MSDLINLARKAEKENNWEEAERLWLLVGSKSDADACKMIYESNERADHYRSRVLNEAGPEPDKCENPRAWVKWYDHMNKIYREIYVQSK
jgi:hypothetical protein